MAWLSDDMIRPTKRVGSTDFASVISAGASCSSTGSACAVSVIGTASFLTGTTTSVLTTSCVCSFTLVFSSVLGCSLISSATSFADSIATV